jgi:hypothetical protein
MLQATRKREKEVAHSTVVIFKLTLINQVKSFFISSW